MIVPRIRFLSVILLATSLLVAPSLASAEGYGWSTRRSTIVEVLSRTDGAQALVAAVLVVDEARVLDFSLAELLSDPERNFVVFAPGNAAFEDLLGLEAGFLDGLSIAEVKAALPAALPTGVGPAEVAAILLKHVGSAGRGWRSTAYELALLRKGSITVADGSVLPVSIGAAGVAVNYESTIIRKDVRARNGVIQFVDGVILDGLL